MLSHKGWITKAGFAKFSDELAGFEEAWKVKAQRSMPGLSGSSIGYGNMGRCLSC